MKTKQSSNWRTCSGCGCAPCQCGRIDAELGIVLAIAAFILLLCAWAVHESRRETREWVDWRNAHGCKPVARIEGTTVYKGYVNPKTGWLCDDGMTYYKED
jgi:hypothetical protein